MMGGGEGVARVGACLVTNKASARLAGYQLFGNQTSVLPCLYYE